MANLLLFLTAISAALYLLVALTSRFRKASERRNVRVQAPKSSPAYFWGFAFVVLFYYGFPVWWWRYGFQNACKLILYCILIVAATQAILRYANLVEVHGLGDSFAVSLLIAVPIRALAGFWVAKNDGRLRNAIVIDRSARRKRCSCIDA